MRTQDACNPPYPARVHSSFYHLKLDSFFVHAISFCTLEIDVMLCFEMDWSAVRLDEQMHHRESRRGDAASIGVLQAHLTGVREFQCLRMQQTI